MEFRTSSIANWNIQRIDLSYMINITNILTSTTYLWVHDIANKTSKFVTKKSER